MTQTIMCLQQDVRYVIIKESKNVIEGLPLTAAEQIFSVIIELLFHQTHSIQSAKHFNVEEFYY